MTTPLPASRRRTRGGSGLLLPRLAAAMLTACTAALAGSLLAPAHAADTVVVTVGTQRIMQSDLDRLANGQLRELALKRLILKDIIDQEAAKARISVTDAEVDAAVAKWKADAFNGSEALYEGELARQGSTPALYREVVREGMIADQLVARPTTLVDADYDQEKIQPYFVRDADTAQKVYQALTRGDDVPTIIRTYGVEMLNPIDIYRYDPRFDRAILDRKPDGLFWLAEGQFTRPIPSTNPPGYQIMKVLSQVYGKSMSRQDRETIAPLLIQEKVKVRLQDWWGGIESQVAAIYARAGGAAGDPGAAADRGATGHSSGALAPATNPGNAPGTGDGDTLDIKVIH